MSFVNEVVHSDVPAMSGGYFDIAKSNGFGESVAKLAGATHCAEAQ